MPGAHSQGLSMDLQSLSLSSLVLIIYLKYYLFSDFKVSAFEYSSLFIIQDRTVYVLGFFIIIDDNKTVILTIMMR